MFGYIQLVQCGLSEEYHKIYRSYYCGLCKALKMQNGSWGRVYLSYDFTFLSILLHSLYEPENKDQGDERCLIHPVKPHSYINSEISKYCADMNIALAYHKCKDDWNDDGKILSLYQVKYLKKRYQDIYKIYPRQCMAIEKNLQAISEIEKSKIPQADALANLTGNMLGEIYKYKDDIWQDTLYRVGQGLGRFIYLMDAYDDYDKDIKKKRYNPLTPYHERADYNEFVKEVLTLYMGECTEAFETLPLINELDILRNILYGGCWVRYNQINSNTTNKDDNPKSKQKNRSKKGAK